MSPSFARNLAECSTDLYLSVQILPIKIGDVDLFELLLGEASRARVHLLVSCSVSKQQRRGNCGARSKEI